MSARVLLNVSVITAALAGVASACPVCHGETGRQVRAGVFDDDFGRNVLAIAAPFAVVAGVTAAVHLGGGRGRGES
jgi:hypothetical protein